MRRIIIHAIGASLCLLWLSSCQGELTEISFFTEGNCTACKPLIEAALAEQKGVDYVQWDYESSLTTVRYEAEKIDEDALQQLVADAGFRTGYFDPNPTTRKQLPDCCRQAVDRRLQEELPTGH